MDNKNLLESELKSLMKEETDGLKLSTTTIQNILKYRKKTWKERIRDFLNKEIEIPLAPALIGFAALLAITTIPKDIFKNTEVKIIDMGPSQVIIREKEVSRR